MNTNIQLGRGNVICLSSKDRAIIDCLMSFLKKKGSVESISELYKIATKKVGKRLNYYHLKYCLMILCKRNIIKLINRKNKFGKHWRIKVEWKG